MKCWLQWTKGNMGQFFLVSSSNTASLFFFKSRHFNNVKFGPIDQQAEQQQQQQKQQKTSTTTKGFNNNNKGVATCGKEQPS